MEEKPIGGYFELELRKGQHYHNDAFRFNSARNCLAVILSSRKWRKVYLPYYTCEAILQPIVNLGLEYGFYHIDYSFNPINLPVLNKDEAIVYTNYYGLKQEVVEELAVRYSEQLIIDNAQAFFSPRIPGIDTFYSPRKFLGVPDGGYLYSDRQISLLYEKDHSSWSRANHLFQRIDEGPEYGYCSFRQAEDSIGSSSIKMMSVLTESLLASIDYESIIKIRRNNYLVYQTILSQSNYWSFSLRDDEVPMCYPFLSTVELRDRLLNARVFIPYYWKNVKEWCPKGCEAELSERLLALPLDQRYCRTDIEKVISIIKQ